MKFNYLTFILMLASLQLLAQETPLYIGTFTNDGSQGIYHTTFNEETGKMGVINLAIATDDPSFLALSPNKTHLYAAHKNGFVSSYKIEPNYKLSLLTRVKSEGKGACHIAVNTAGNKAVVSNYGNGTAAIFPIDSDGMLGEASQVFNKNSENKTSRAHSAFFNEDELYVAYLGKNAVSQYKLQKGDNNNIIYKLKENAIVNVTRNPGPRHFTFTKNGKFVYIINELASSITVAKKTKKGFKLVETVSTLPKDFNEKNNCADIHLSNNERFLYGSNRGQNTIAIFERNPKNGKIKHIKNVPVHGNWPRNFTLSPNGNYVLVANQKSHNISVFKVNKTNGNLNFLYDVKTPSPVCLIF